MPPDGYPAFQYLQSVRVRKVSSWHYNSGGSSPWSTGWATPGTPWATRSSRSTERLEWEIRGRESFLGLSFALSLATTLAPNVKKTTPVPLSVRLHYSAIGKAFRSRRFASKRLTARSNEPLVFVSTNE